MRHERHYSLEEARAARPRVADLLATMRAARRGLTDEQARAALTEAAPTNGGGRPGRLVGESFTALRAAIVALQAMEVVLRDLERGLVDFPAIRDGEEVYLCWIEAEEEDIGHWHGLDAGLAGREPW